MALALAFPAQAQNFPSGAAWVPLPCGGGVMVDAANDTPGATGALDLVGGNPSPAGYHAADGNFLYLRMRVAGNPVSGARFLANGWGYELDLDGNRDTYELLFSVSGLGPSDEVAVYRHPTTITPGNPAEAAAAPPAFTYAASSHAQVVAAGSALAGGTDYFIDLALPWNDLATLNVMRNTRVGIWAGSSTVANALDLDLACFGGTGGTLGGIDVGATTPDPQPPGGTTGGTTGTLKRTLEGGPGCSVSGSADSSWWMMAMAFLWMGLRKRLRSLANPVRAHI